MSVLWVLINLNIWLTLFNVQMLLTCWKCWFWWFGDKLFYFIYIIVMYIIRWMIESLRLRMTCFGKMVSHFGLLVVTCIISVFFLRYSSSFYLIYLYVYLFNLLFLKQWHNWIYSMPFRIIEYLQLNVYKCVKKKKWLLSNSV